MFFEHKKGCLEANKQVNSVKAVNMARSLFLALLLGSALSQVHSQCKAKSGVECIHRSQTGMYAGFMGNNDYCFPVTSDGQSVSISPNLP